MEGIGVMGLRLRMEGMQLRSVVRPMGSSMVRGMEVELVIRLVFFFFSSRRRHTRSLRDWSSDVCSSDLRPPEDSLVYESARSQMASVNIEDELDDHLKIGGLLYSFISLKDLPDATFPGLLQIGRASCRERV